MGLVEEFKNLFHGNDEEDDDYEEIMPRQAGRSELREATASQRGNKVVNINATTQLSVVLVKPELFENAAEIADHLKEVGGN